MTEEEIYRRAVYELQVFLAAAALENPQIPEVKADGIYGPETREAVRQFQQIYGLPVTGDADQETWEALREVYYQALLRTGAPPALELFAEETSIPAGGDMVYVVQIMLRALGERYRQFSGVEVTGQLDPATTDALEALWTVVDAQPRDGYTGKDTVRLLGWLYNAARQEQTA